MRAAYLDLESNPPSAILLSKATRRTIRKHGQELCLDAHSRHLVGDGSITIGFCLGVHWRTADALINAGRELRRVLHLSDQRSLGEALRSFDN